MTEQQEEALFQILAILKRVEERQIRTTAMVQEVSQQEPTQGGFGTTDYGDKEAK